MRWISHQQAQTVAFSSSDVQTIAFRLPGHLPPDRVHLLGRNAFGFRAQVIREDGCWVVKRREYLDRAIATRRDKQERRRKQTRRVALRGGL